MASGNNHDREPSGNVAANEPPRSIGRLVEFDNFIDARLRKTRGHVRSVDVASGLMLLVTGTLGYLLLAALFDHWIVPGGLGVWGRSLFLAVYLACAVALLVTQVLPALVYRVNPLYAAQTIERSQPSLKNALVNFLFFRDKPASVNRRIYEAVEEQAATSLAATGAQTAVDRTRLIRIGYVLLCIFLVCAVYVLASPKDAFKTVGRIAVPWADIDAPTRTTITGIEPGDARAFRGQQIEVRARVQNPGDDGRVMLYYSTADGQIVDAPIEMSLGGDRYNHTCLLPAGDASLQQDLRYRIEAGDAITRPFEIEVVAAPTIFVRSIEYNYPKYTGLLAQRVQRQGDIKAIEGTEVTIHALANGEIQSAHVDFDCNRTPDQPMTIEGLRAIATFRLTLEEDRKTPWHNSYQLLLKNLEGQQNPQPVRHEIEVTRDIAPQIEFVAPKNAEIDLPANGALVWEVVANDPDFALEIVKLSAAKNGQPLFDKLVLDETHRGQFVTRFRFEPAKLGLVAGDVVEYSALAEDNKNPRPNRSQTVARKIRIVSPTEQESQGDQLAQNDPSGQRGQQPDQRDQPGHDNQPPDARSDESQQSEQDKQKEQGDNQDQPDGQQDGEDQGESRRGQQGAKQDEPGEQNRDDDLQSAQQGQGQQGQGQQGQGQQGQGQQGASEPGTDEPRQGEQRQSGEAGDAAGERQKRDTGGQGDPSQERETSVPNDGSNDGDAIERILEHRQQQQGEDSQQGDRQQQREPQRDRRSAEDRQQEGDRGQSDSSQPRPSSDGRQKRPENRVDDRQGQPAGDAGKQDEQRGSPPGASRQGDRESRSDDKSPPEARQRDGESKQRQDRQTESEPRAESDPMPGGQPQSPDASRPDSDTPGQQNQGESGAGQKGQEQEGSPMPQEQTQPRDKSRRPDGAKESPEEPNREQSPANSKRESDSEGDDDGDRAGGGKRGGGQKADQPGTGGAGENTAADEGAGAAEQTGKGDTSERAGRDQQAGDETGERGSQKGKGSQSDPGDDKGGKSGTAGSPDSPSQPSGESAPTGSEGPSSGVPAGGQPGGRPGEPPTGTPPSGPEVEDPANLEYARKATDLALAHLKDELAKDKPDQELLDRLGWSRDDLERFIKRWDEMRVGAKASGEEGESAQHELDETLRSLGLRPKTTSLRSSDAREDTFKGLRESRRSSPPPEYAEQTKAYTQGTARGGK